MDRISSIVGATILAICMVASGCIDLPGTKKGDDEGAVSEDVKAIGSDSLSLIGSVSEDMDRIAFTGTNDEIEELSKGDVIVCGVSERTPFGFMGRIVDIERSGGGVSFITETVPLEEVVEEGRVEVERNLTSDDMELLSNLPGVELVRPGSGTRADEEGGIAFDDIVLATDPSGGKVTLSGSVMSDWDLRFVCEIEDFMIERLEFGVETKFTGHLEFTSTSKHELSKKVELARVTFGAIIVPLGPIDIILTPVLTLVVGFDGKLMIGTAFEATQITTLSAEVSHPDWTPVTDFDTDFEYTTPTLSYNCSVKGYAGPEFALLIYGIAGPYTSAHGYIEARTAGFPEVSFWGLYGGMEFGLGVRLEALGVTIADWGDPDLIDFRKTIATSSTDLASGWEKELLDPTISSILGPKVDLDEDGGVGLCYYGTAPNTTAYSGRSSALKFARSEGGVWTFETIEFMSKDFGYDLQFTSEGVPIVVYPGPDKGSIMMARRDGAGWSKEKVPSVDPTIAKNTLNLLLDDRDRPWLYYSSGKGLMYSHLDGSEWSNGTIFGREVNVSILAIDGTADGSGEHHLSSLLFDDDEDSLILKYSTNDGGDWSTEEIDRNASAKLMLMWSLPSTSIALDAGSDPHIVYEELVLGTDELTVEVTQLSRKNAVWGRDVNSDPMDNINIIGLAAVSGKIDIAISGDTGKYLSYLTASEGVGLAELEYDLKVAIPSAEGWTKVMIDTWIGSWYFQPSAPELYFDNEGKACILLNTGYDLIFYRWSG